MKTNYKNISKRYELASRMVWFKTPPWKQKVIIDCRINETNDRIFDEYAKEVHLMAEDDKSKFDESLPVVPDIKKAAEISSSMII